MKRNTIFLSAIAGTLLLTACGGGSVGRQADNAIVADTDETENGMAGTEENTAAAEPGNSVLPVKVRTRRKKMRRRRIRVRRRAQSRKNRIRTRTPGRGKNQKRMKPKRMIHRKKRRSYRRQADRLRISCRAAGRFWTVWSWISMRTVFPIM